MSVLLLPAVLDSVFTVVLAVASLRRRMTSGQGRGGFRWLVLVPARREGGQVEPVLAAVTGAPRIGAPGNGAPGNGASSVQAALILDGPDPEAEAVAGRLGVAVHVKTPEGPSKAAVLAWAAERLRGEFQSADGVLVLDVGSVPCPGFFSSFSIPEGKDAVQAFLGGAARGVGEAIRHSETFAQRVEDAGREALGWSVRLRGTGTGFRPGVFSRVSASLKTQVEDLEASLLLAAAGGRAVMGPPEAIVLDEKPEDVERAAVQRARWFVGRWQLLVRRRGVFLRLLRRHPVEGLAFLVEIWGRPFVLSVAFRVAWSVVLGGGVAMGLFRPEFFWVAGVFFSSTFLTAGAVLATGRPPLRSLSALTRSWTRSLGKVPEAVAGWLRAR
ncbi:MAG: glycosyltransferase family 2 protein [Acidobacteria bacterium]|nr:glycosyltransferase family 2 protein [Acidobacteriota bacterium]